MFCLCHAKIEVLISLKRYGLLCTLLLLSPQLSFAHSAMFPDGFKFDNTNEGDRPVSTIQLNQNLALHKAGDITGALSACVNGLAGGYPCSNIDLQSVLSPTALGGNAGNLNDIWGWTDIVTGKEIAIVGRHGGTSFVDMTDSTAPVLLGFLPSHGDHYDSWRDIKVYADHAFIVADGYQNIHGLQVFDLTTLADVAPGAILEETAHLGGFGRAHNIAINEDTGFAYVVGASVCSGGLYMVDVSVPASPSYAGCFSADGYTHDAQCVVYNGPDVSYQGREICLAFNEDSLTIVDVSNKTNPVSLSSTSYQGVNYTHQGWFFNDRHSYVILNDELDEYYTKVGTTSYVFDVSDLADPQLVGRYVGPTSAIDHNLYTKDDLIYETNYRAGLRVLGEVDIAEGCLEELAYFDTIPGSNSAQFSGTWSSYVYFDSGNIALSDIEYGLFIVRPDYSAIMAAKSGDRSGCSAAQQPESVSRGGGALGIQLWFALFFVFIFFKRRRYLYFRFRLVKK